MLAIVKMLMTILMLFKNLGAHYVVLSDMVTEFFLEKNKSIDILKKVQKIYIYIYIWM